MKTEEFVAALVVGTLSLVKVTFDESVLASERGESVVDSVTSE